jgi:hypothetical protein
LQTPFLEVRTVVIPITCAFDDFGLLLEADPMSHQNLVVDVTPYSSASHLKWTTQLQFNTVIQIDDTPVFTVTEGKAKLASLSDTNPDYCKMFVALYKPDAKDQYSPLPQVALDQLRVIQHFLHGWDLAVPVMLITAENAGNMSQGTYYTRHTCLKGPYKGKSLESEFEMLDKNDVYGIYGPSIKRCDVPSTVKIVCPIWNYSQKTKGVHKARNCMDGKQLVRIGVKFSNMYAA